jgi:OOP family OmpA-OmpF porin
MRRRHILIIGTITCFVTASAPPAGCVTAESATPADQYAATARKRAAIAQENADRAALTAVIAEKQAERADRKSTTASAELEHGLAELKGRETAHGFVLTLSDILFAPDQAEPTPAGMHKLSSLVTILKAQPQRSIRIEGHTDSRGPESYNFDLSQRRADAVRDFLIENGIPSQRITAQGYGEAVAVASNTTGAGRQENRRVEVIVPR